MVIAVIPLVVTIVGALLYALASGKASTLGLWAFGIGLFWLIAGVAQKTIAIGSP